MFDFETTVAEIELKVRKLKKENELLGAEMEKTNGQ